MSKLIVQVNTQYVISSLNANFLVDVIITSLAKEVMFLVAFVCLFVCLSVCLSVCLWTTLLKKVMNGLA